MIETTLSPFDVLGVPEAASRDEIRRAYRRQALRFHPDRNPNDPSAREAFLAVQEAYRRLDRRDPDAGFDAERVVSEMQKAAREAERRRRRGGEGVRAWQQVHVELHRPASERLRAKLGTNTARLGAVAGVVAGGLVMVGFAPFVHVVAWLMGYVVVVPAWLPVLLGVVVAVGVAARLVAQADPGPWAVETHWQGLRDLRWDVLLSWSEILSVEEGENALRLRLTEAAARRLHGLVPASTFAEPGLYDLPLTDGARLGTVIQAQIAR